MVVYDWLYLRWYVKRIGGVFVLIFVWVVVNNLKIWVDLGGVCDLGIMGVSEVKLFLRVYGDLFVGVLVIFLEVNFKNLDLLLVILYL